jgi:hypothetical protein
MKKEKRKGKEKERRNKKKEKRKKKERKTKIERKKEGRKERKYPEVRLLKIPPAASHKLSPNPGNVDLINLFAKTCEH